MLICNIGTAKVPAQSLEGIQAEELLSLTLFCQMKAIIQVRINCFSVFPAMEFYLVVSLDGYSRQHIEQVEK